MRKPEAHVPELRAGTGPDTSHEVLLPAEQKSAVVIASPHSGRRYPASFVASSRLDPAALRKSEDCYVDELFRAAPEMGIPLLRAHFPRAYIDVNREPFELDPKMFRDALPSYVTTRSPRITAGLGTIARIVASGHEIYARKLDFADALDRVMTHYKPYHSALASLVTETMTRFGRCILLDAHSMPSIAGAAGDWEMGSGRVDFVLGDCHGLSCDPKLVDLVEDELVGMGYSVARNEPYPGGFTTRHYGQPGDGVHALQIEINRSLYMNEATYEPQAYFSVLADHMRNLLAAVGAAGAKS